MPERHSGWHPKPLGSRKAVGLKEIERYPAMGRDYLRLAHNAAKLKEVHQEDEWMNLMENTA